jgi:kynurenine 3-monooxygenase
MTGRGEVHVVGSGLVGPVTAILLARRGYRVRLYDRRPDPRHHAAERGRSVSLVLSARGWRALAEVGLEEEVRALCMPLRGRSIHAWRGGVAYQPYGRRGEEISCVERPLLHRLLSIKAMEEPGVDAAWEHRCAAMELDEGRLGFQLPGRDRSDLKWVSFERALGSDGAFSHLRGEFLHETFDFQQRWLHLAYKELRLPPASEGGPALDATTFHVWPRGRFFLGAFPNRDGSFAASLFLPRTGHPSFETVQGEGDFRALVQTFFPALMPWLPALWGQFRDHPVAPLVTMRCQPWAWKGRFSLLGDAAHAVVPFLGQGMNCGLEDARVLARCLDEHGHDWARALPRFEAERRPNADALAALSLAHYEHLSQDPHPMDELRHRVEQLLEQLEPYRFRPLYELVAFTDAPYATIERLEAQKRALVDQLLQDPRLRGPWTENVRELVASALRARLDQPGTTFA